MLSDIDLKSKKKTEYSIRKKPGVGNTSQTPHGKIKIYHLNISNEYKD